MFQFIKKYFDYNERELESIRKVVIEINKLEDKAKSLKDRDFVKETKKLKEIIQTDEAKIDEQLPWAFALTREAARRVLGQRHFDVQLIAGVALHRGKIAEQKTGEGKTLSATTALYLNALTGKGVHLVTVNDYLARRDAGWMGQVFDFLGLKTAAIISDESFIFENDYQNKDVQDSRLIHLKQCTRREAYQADITYGINSEFGFDYLRDNMAPDTANLVQRGFYYAIIDEADSVLIDEARTPHIISAPFAEDTSKYYQYAKIVKTLERVNDYVIDEKARTANLTEVGIMKIEKMLGVDNIYEKDFDTLFHIEAALKAETLFRNNKEYIVKNNEIIIVDEFTGRLLQGRRFSEGIHQAIEAKENVAIQKESKTLATVSLQNYFRMYKKLAGMTGTAATEAEEFHKIYKADVLVIPTHRAMIRKDFPDMIYKTEKGKFEAVVEEIAEQYKKGRPVLVGTTAIDKNEYLSSLLKKKGIPHELLNAKNHEREAQIIANAGKPGAVTVATNMAGRGVDIILGGAESTIQNSESRIQKRSPKSNWDKEHEKVVESGGLYIIGTERHESRRIDNQLRGRSGRQGDPGESRFFVSLEDDLMRIFGGEQISKLMTAFHFPEDQALTHPMVSRAIEQAQVKVEGFNFDIRKHLVDYDDVLNKQREIVYTLRRKILLQAEEKTEEFKETVTGVIKEEVEQLIAQYFFAGQPVEKEMTDNFIKEASLLIEIEPEKIKRMAEKNEIEALKEYLYQSLAAEFSRREKKYGQEIWLQIVRSVFLTTIDRYWTEHLTAMEDLREGINLRGYAQLDPLVEYKNEAFSMFEKLIASINYEATRRIFKVEVDISSVQPAEEPKDKPMVFKSASSVDPFTLSQQSQTQPEARAQQPVNTSISEGGLDMKVIPPGTSHKKLGRNDPCWCGSGKKYKKCHYPN
jgi:preprotein translocase subunit SecA